MIKYFTIKKVSRYSLYPFWIAALLMVCITAKGQYPVSSYTFSQTAGTYTPITGGTVIASSIPDNAAYPSITLTPGFTFCGTVYTNAFVTADGLITLGGTTAANNTNGMVNGGGSGILLCPFNTDMIGSNAAGASPGIRYQLVGNEHVFQWSDISRYPASTDRFSFQARLNYVTGVITYVYSVTSVGTSTSYPPAIGIRTATTAGNWQNRLIANTATSSWAASAPGTVISDICRFTSNATNPKQPVTGQTYTYTPPPACNTSSSLPAAGTVTASPGSLCLTGNVTLSFAPATVMPVVTGITYKWQTSPTAAGTYTDIPGGITSVPAYTTTVPISANAYFKCVVLCNGSTVVLTSAASNQVVVNNPGSPTGTPGTRCGPGSVALSATGPAGTTIRWYDAATGGAPLFTGANFNTPYITNTRNFYVTAGSAPAPANATVGAGVLTSSFDEVTIFAGDWGGYKHQFLITEAEMIAAGILPGSNINNISVDNASGTGTYNGLRISLKSTTVASLTTTFETGSTPVYGPTNYTTTAGINTFTLTAPFTWTGGSLLIETCWSNGTTSNPYSNIRYDNTSFAATHYNYNDSQTPTAICAMTSGGSSVSLRPQFKFNYDASCQSARLPVLATVTTPPAITKTLPAIVCNNTIAPITVSSSPMSNYTAYSWTPAVTDLYTDAAATVPYTSGSAPTVFMKSNVAGQHIYYLYATGATPSACAFADTVKIWVQPALVTIQAFPDTLCAPSGSTTLKLSPIAGYAPNSIQWQESVNGTAFNDIAGANSATFVTPVLTANHYYKALINSGTATICEAPVKLIVLSDPHLISWADSFHCGPGTVTLNAEAGGYSNVRWYTSATANLPIATGNTWTTPYLSNTTTYFVEAGAGAIQPPPTFIGNGTSASSGVPLAYGACIYTTQKAQWLITAAEMQAAGFTGGLITDIGFDVTTKSGNTNISSLNYSMKQITGPMGTALHTGMQPVFSTTNYNPVPNTVNTHTLQSPFYWDGTSNLVIEECSYNPTNQFGTVNVKYNTSGPCLVSYTTTTGTAALNNCVAPVSVNSVALRPNIRFSMTGGCHSARQPVTAYIRPVPVVDLGPDINKCVDPGYAEVLDAGIQPDSAHFLWDNNSVNQQRSVNVSGTYSVTVTNQYGCAQSDEINVTLRHNPVVDLGNDTTVCNGVQLTLDADNPGDTYLWNTGQTTQSINITAPGTYKVNVSNSAGCFKSDNIVVTMQGQLPSMQGINIVNNGQYTFQFTVVNPYYVTGYDWDFGDGSAHSSEASPTHTYASEGNYIVTLRLSSTCGFLNYTIATDILGIHQLNINKDELIVYPNPTRSVATILNRGALRMENIEVYNILGQVVYKAKADSQDKHMLNLAGFASGVYTIQVFTDKGTVARKLEIIK